MLTILSKVISRTECYNPSVKLEIQIVFQLFFYCNLKVNKKLTQKRCRNKYMYSAIVGDLANMFYHKVSLFNDICTLVEPESLHLP